MQQKMAPRKPPDAAVSFVRVLASAPAARRGSLEVYRMIDAAIAQDEQRHSLRPSHSSWRARPAVARHGAGHGVAGQAPDQLLAALTTFLGPYP
jgi:hypothetical protein